MFSLYAKHYDKFYQNKPYKKEIKFVYKWADNPSFILDIGCGSANYWKYYPDYVRLVGVEKSKDMIKQAGIKAIITEDILNFNPVIYMHSIECMTALFNVINYIPDHSWWSKFPLKKDGYFIFDIWDKNKVDREGFKQTIRRVGDITRVITPMDYNGHKVRLNISISNGGEDITEIHTMYIYSRSDIERFAGDNFVIEGVKTTNDWHIWYRLRKK